MNQLGVRAGVKCDQGVFCQRLVDKNIEVEKIAEGRYSALFHARERVFEVGLRCQFRVLGPGGSSQQVEIDLVRGPEHGHGELSVELDHNGLCQPATGNVGGGRDLLGRIGRGMSNHYVLDVVIVKMRGKCLDGHHFLLDRVVTAQNPVDGRISGVGVLLAAVLRDKMILVRHLLAECCTMVSPMPARKKQADSERLDRAVTDARRDHERRVHGFREQALTLFPWICAHCGREFSRDNLRELTVHHKDHNHENNPPDGSNWELLCLYCHDMEHAGSVEAGDERGSRREARPQEAATYKPLANLDALLKQKK